MHNSPKMDIVAEDLYQTMASVLRILLRDRTVSAVSKKCKNIIWANDNYMSYGKQYAPKRQITIGLITGDNRQIIKPRAFKSTQIQKQRTKTKAEVFTPTWIVKKQNDALDEDYQQDDLLTYVNRTWLEITCGEAPYMTTRYDMQTGQAIQLACRVGFVDRKLQRINDQIDDKKRWLYFVIKAYQSSYGFEWNGDSLLLARQNLLYTFREYYHAKWQDEPTIAELKKIATIISYNVFQMDGIALVAPLRLMTKKTKPKPRTQLSLFDNDTDTDNDDNNSHQIPIPVKIKNWQTGKMQLFKEN